MPSLSSDDNSDVDSGSVNDESQTSKRTGASPVRDDAPGDPNHSRSTVSTTGLHLGQTIDTDKGVTLGEECASGRAMSTPLPHHQEVFFTTTDFYLALRMHHLLAERLSAARKLCREAALSRETVVPTSQKVSIPMMAELHNTRWVSYTYIPSETPAIQSPPVILSFLRVRTR